MKKLSIFLLVLTSLLVSLVAALFVFIEGRLLLSFDWTLHEQEFMGFVQYLARVALAIYAFSIGINSIRYRHQKRFTFEGASILAIAIALAFHITNTFGIYFIILAALYFGTTIFVAIAHRDEEDDMEDEDY